MNKLIVLIATNLFLAVLIVSAVLFSTSSDEASVNQLVLKTKIQNKEAELNVLKNQMQVIDVDLIKNIDAFKKYLKSYDPQLVLEKTSKNKRGMQYLLSGESTDLLVFLYKAMQGLKFEVLGLVFKQKKMFANITIIGTEK